VNLIGGCVITASEGGLVIESTGAGRIRAAPLTGDAQAGATVWVALRPEKLRLVHERPAATDLNCAAGQVSDIAYLGDLSVYKVRLDSGFEMKVSVANMTRLIERPISWDDRVWLAWAPDAGIVLTR
jgi:putrescine transport system ATP-binding protein